MLSKFPAQWRSALMAAVLLLPVGHSAREAAAQLPADATPSGGASDEKCCLFRLELHGENASRSFKEEVTFPCKVGDHTHKIAMGKMKVQMQLVSPGLPCDESKFLGDLPDKCNLLADGLYRHRDDGFAEFSGKFEIKVKDKVLYSGAIELIDRITSFHKPLGSEPCDIKNRVQGWLVGQSPQGTHKLRAALIANTRGELNMQTLFDVSMDGVILECQPVKK